MSNAAVLDHVSLGMNSADQDLQIIALHLGEEIYGVNIAHIHTVIIPQAITRVPRTPSYIAGVMNLRGRILPVIDLRTRFGMPPLEEGRKKGVRIVIIDVDGLTAGLIVDMVSEVLRLQASAIEPPSQLVASVETECIVGIGRIAAKDRDGSTPEERLIILLNVYKILTTGPNETAILKKLAA